VTPKMQRSVASPCERITSTVPARVPRRFVRSVIATSVLLSAAAFVLLTACGNDEHHDDDSALPYCDDVFRYPDGTLCETCPHRDADGVWRWPNGEEWDPDGVEILCQDGSAGAPTVGAPGGAAGAGGAPGAGSGGAGGAGESGGGGVEAGGGQGGEAGEPVAPCDSTALPENDACVVDDEYGVFVSAAQEAEGDGTRNSPFASLAAGLAEAIDSGKRLYVCADGGSYGESVALDATATGLEVFGGFRCSDWTYDPTLQASIESSEPTAWVIDGAEQVVLTDLEIIAANATEPGGSSVAMFLKGGADATLEHVRLQAGDGADGEDGMVEEEFDYPDVGELVGDDGTVTAGAGICSFRCPSGGQTTGGAGAQPTSAGANGLPGEASPPPVDETMGAGGLAGSSCASGGTGEDGSPGTPGERGNGASVLGTLTSDGWTPASGTSGRPGGPGQGGGGGASQGSDGGGGGGGCGACGGAGATAGQGGGASIALIRLGSTVTLRDCVLVTGNGGQGGDASPGQTGQSSGGIGGNRGGDACNGGNGGPGGDGGASGAGAGGISVGILYDGAMPSVQGVTDAQLGNLGQSGAGVDGLDDTDSINGVSQAVLQAE